MFVFEKQTKNSVRKNRNGGLTDFFLSKQMPPLDADSELSKLVGTLVQRRFLLEIMILWSFDDN